MILICNALCIVIEKTQRYRSCSPYPNFMEFVLLIQFKEYIDGRYNYFVAR